MSRRSELTKDALQTCEFLTGGALVRVPHHDREMVPPQRVPDRLAGRVDVDLRLPGYELANAQCAKAVLIFQPPFALLFVHCHDLLGDPVDVLEERGRDRLDRRET